MRKFLLLCLVFPLLFSFALAAVCGNGTCEVRETFVTCPADCNPSTIAIEVLEFDSAKTYLRGDDVFVKVKITADGMPIGGINASVIGFFGSMKLYDDGDHEDESPLDTIFANSFTIPQTAIVGKKKLRITADFRGIVGTKTVEMQLDPSLDLLLLLNKTRFVSGDVIELEGYLKKRGKPLETELLLKFVFDGNTMKTVSLNTDAAGAYSHTYRTSLIDPTGEWDVVVTGSDELGNEGRASETFGLYKGIQDFYYDLEFIEPISRIFNRGEIVKFLVELKDSGGNFVEEAKVSITMPNADSFELSEISEGSYSYSYKVPYDFSLGKQTATAVASKDINGFLFSGFSSKGLIIDKGRIFIEMRNPEKRVFTFGDAINFEFRLHYFDNTLVSKAQFDLKVNNMPLQVEEVTRGVYTATYIVSEEIEIEDMPLSLIVFDPSGNEGTYSDEFAVRAGSGALYFIQRNFILFTGIIAVVAFVLAMALLSLKKFTKTRGLLKRKVELQKLLIELKQQYYEKGKIKTPQYREFANRYQGEIDEIDAVLGVEGKK